MSTLKPTATTKSCGTLDEDMRYFVQAGPIGTKADGKIHKSPSGPFVFVIFIHDAKEMLSTGIYLSNHNRNFHIRILFQKGPKSMGVHRFNSPKRFDFSRQKYLGNIFNQIEPPHLILDRPAAFSFIQKMSPTCVVKID
jgi:hypothetical protein